MSALPRLQLSDLEPSSRDPLAQGGRGSIYRVKLRRMLSPDLVLGVTYLLKVPREKLTVSAGKSMESHLDELHKRLQTEANFFPSRLALPIAIVERDENYVGYLMREFNDGCYFEKKFTYGGVELARQELKIFLNSHSERVQLGVPSINTRRKVQIAAEVFNTLALLHEKGLVVGDLSGSNLILQNKKSKTSALRVIYLDVDSFSYRSGRESMGHESTLHWRSPEELQTPGIPATKASDVYKAALLVRRLFHQERDSGSNSYDIYKSKISNQVLSELGGPALADLISRAINVTVEARPYATELAFHFRELANVFSEKS